jgi:protein OS-9
VVFSDSFISDVEANLIISHASSTINDGPQSSNTNIESAPPSDSSHAFDPAHETYEVMILDDEQYFCAIPIVEPLVKNGTSEAEARAAEQKELARATDRGWELLQDLEGDCLYYVSGWWSYSFCYNNEIVQFHQLPPQPGKPLIPPVRDPTTKQFVLGKAKAAQQTREDEWGNEIDVHKGAKHGEPPKTELQVKGDTRYLVQRMEGGTTFDLTGKPRRVEVQYHCNPHVTDRIGYIKEVTTCSYLMVVYTPRLCTDAAFMPAKENKANEIVCRVIVPEDDMEDRTELKILENELDAANAKMEKPINIGGVIVGGGKWAAKDGARMPIPANFGQENQGKVIEVIARAKPMSEGGQVEMASDADLRKLDLDPATVDELRKEVQKMAREKGWEIKVVDEPGEIRTILWVVDGEDEDEEGSEEIYKDEL